MKKVFKSLKFLYVLIVLYFLPISLFAQSPVNVTATVKDSAGIPYSNATVSILLIPTGTAPTVGGAQISGTNNGQLDVNGKLNVSLYKNTDIVPASSQWQFTICETPGVAPPLGTGGQCFTSSQTVSAAVDFSTQFQAAAKALTTVTVGGSGSVTHTAGNLTAGNVVIGNGAADVKVDSACVTNGTGALSGCTSLSAGSGASAAGATATGGFACVEAASTGWTPTVGQDYQRCDSTAHAFVCSNNGAAESACSPAPSFPVTVGGTVTSGGVPYFSSTTVESSSAVLAAGALVAGGGAGVAPGTGNADFTLPLASHTLTMGAAGVLNLGAGAAGSVIIPKMTSGSTGSAAGALQYATDGDYYIFGASGSRSSMAVAGTGASTGTTCTNQVITVISALTFPTCTSLTNAFLPSTITAKDPLSINNFNQAAQSQVVVSATEYYLTRSDLDMPAVYTTAIGAGTTMKWHVTLNKTAAGTGTFQVLLKKGTNGSTADTSIVTQTIGTQTAAADNMEMDVQLTWTSATAAYWAITPRQSAASGTGFGLVYPAVAAQFNGTISGQTTTTASDKYGLSVIFTTGTPTFLVTEVQAQAFGVN